MKRYIMLAALFSAFYLSASFAQAQEALWQNSYQLEKAGKYTEAIAAIAPIAVNSPDAELKVMRRGWLYYLLGSYNESIREYRLAIERNNKSIDARLGLTLPFIAQQRWREVEINARAALELAPNNYIALIRLAIAEEGQHDWNGMKKTSNTLVINYPSDANAFVYLARAEAGSGKRDEAIAAYIAVLSRYPGHLEATAYLKKNNVLALNNLANTKCKAD